MLKMEEIINRYSGFNHVIIKVENEAHEHFTIAKEGSEIRSVTSRNNPMNITDRAVFSIDRAINFAASDIAALEIQLASRPNSYESWKEAYAVETMLRLATTPESELEISSTNEPLSDAELAVEFKKPIQANVIDEAVQEESEAITTARKDMGFTDAELDHIGIMLVKSPVDDGSSDPTYEPKKDAEKFVLLACGTAFPINALRSYSSGFYWSKILETIIEMKNNGIITLHELIENNEGNYEYGEEVEFRKQEEEPPQEDSGEDTYTSQLLSYVDAENPDDIDESEMLNSITSDDPALLKMVHESQHYEAPQPQYEPIPDADDYDAGLTNEDDDIMPAAPDDSALLNVPDLPPVNNPVTEQEESTDSAYDTTTNVFNGGLETEENPDTEVVEEESVIEEEPQSDDGENEQEQEEDAALEEAHHEQDGDADVNELVGFIAQARTKLDALRSRKDDIDSTIDELNAIDIEETEALIESYEENKKKLERKIAELREQKATVITDINNARKQKEEQQEQLSHLNEYEAESEHLSKQIDALEQALDL